MIFPTNLVQIAENFIANPPTSGVELDELIRLHLRLAMALKLHAVLGGIPREEISQEIELCDALYELVEQSLKKEFHSEDEDDDSFFLEVPLPFRAPVPRKSFFVEGNTTIH
jgi:hypothetical protein